MGDDDEHPPYFQEEDEGTVQLKLSDVAAARLSKSAPQQPFLIVYAGEAAGRMVHVGTELTVGRSSQAGLQLHGEGVSRLHARLFRGDLGVFVEDLGSTNGTHVNGEKVVGRRELADGDQIQVGVNLLLKFSLQDEAQARFQQELYEAALRDPLTNVFNRRAFVERLEADISHSSRHGMPLTLLMFDLDHFKNVNDTYGHLAGDAVLSEFANLVLELIRREDTFARYGGEEFVMACRSTPTPSAALLGERIRAAVAEHRFVHDGRKIPVTVSIGVAHAIKDDTVQTLIDRADQMLYQAKHQGRNRVIFAS